jgi:hypothetical protein
MDTTYTKANVAAARTAKKGAACYSNHRMRRLTAFDRPLYFD